MINAIHGSAIMRFGVMRGNLGGVGVGFTIGATAQHLDVA